MATSTSAIQSKEARVDATAAPTNPRGIPYAPFVDRVEDYVSSRGEVEGVLKGFQEMISKYQFMEVSTQRRAAGLRDKIPDIGKTLEMVRFLKTREAGAASPDDGEDGSPGPMEATFELNDTLYARAEVGRVPEVYLWLGANVMLAYPLAEAEALLVGKLEAAKWSLEGYEEDGEFLREQITTLEVATARVYNWDVAQRRREKAEQGDGIKEVEKDENGPDG